LGEAATGGFSGAEAKRRQSHRTPKVLRETTTAIVEGTKCERQASGFRVSRVGRWIGSRRFGIGWRFFRCAGLAW
jgi:hypothetical protein